MEIVKKYWWILAISLALKLIIASTTYHNDIKHFDLAGQILMRGNILNLYDFVDESSALSIINQIDRFNYPPSIYFYHGIFAFIFGGLFSEKFILDFLGNTNSVFGTSNLFWHLLFLKLPLIFFDILLGVLLMSFFVSSRQKLVAFIIWNFNPVSLHAIYMMGQFDIIPTSLVVASLILVKKHKLTQAALILGIAVAFKLYPIFLLLPLVLISEKWSERIKLFMIGVIPYILTIIPFLPSHGFRTIALVASQTDKSFYAKIPISGAENIILFPTLLLFFYLILFFRKTLAENLWQRYFIVLLLFFIFTHTHSQWFLWLVPFLIIDLVGGHFKHVVLTLTALVTYIVLLFFFDPSLTVGIFAPVWPELASKISIWEVLHLSPDYSFSRSIFQSIFVAVSMYLIYYYFPRKET